MNFKKLQNIKLRILEKVIQEYLKGNHVSSTRIAGRKLNILKSTVHNVLQISHYRS